MPARGQPRAAFEPLSPDLNVTELVESTPNFEFVVRIHCDTIDEQGIDEFEKLVLLHVIIGGKPLVVEGYQDRLENWIFGLQWLRDNHGAKIENARNLTSKSNLPLSIRHYLKSMPLLTNQWNDKNYKDTNRQRIYLKDIDCPPVWHEKLRDMLPPFLFYLNETTGNNELDVAKSGDLMSCLPSEMRAENMMCYIGHEGTYTPSHREMCASLGHNIMVETSTGTPEDGELTKPGSSIWFMTESKDRHIVSEYWLSTLGHDIEIENHFAQINAWKSAPFKTYIVEQKVGDFILIPPLAPHQVWNRGTRTMKVAWNRTTVETLEMAMNEALPKARMVCRDEQYKNKAIIYFTLSRYSNLLNEGEPSSARKTRQLQRDFRRLFTLYTDILLSESFSRDVPEPKNVEFIPYSSNITCSYCRCNIFNRFLTCPSCVGKLPDGDDDTYDICMECYTMGRSCACVSKLKWAEQFKWKELTRNHEIWRNQILQFDTKAKDPANYVQSLHAERDRHEKKTLAEICQEELKRRPWVDITKPAVRQEIDEEEVESDDGRAKKRRKVRRSEKWRREHGTCHICKTRESNWKLASCSSCGISYCYGSLFRAFEILPRTVMEDPNWKCPKCRKICSCGACRKDPTMKPFEPSGTSLGHDTRKVADPRSVESLVDFGHSNLAWLKKAGDHPQDNQDTRRLKRRAEEARKAKSKDPTLDEHYVDPIEEDILRLAEQENITIDPSLAHHYASVNGEDGLENGHVPIDPALMSTPQQPSHQFVVPNNAVFQENISDRYEATEAITFEYPDPEASQPDMNNMQNATTIGTQSRGANSGASQSDTGLDFGLDGASDAHINNLIRSDIVPIEPGLSVGGGAQKRVHAVRMEHDDDFTPRKVNGRKSKALKRTGPKKKKTRLTYLEYSSEEETSVVQPGPPDEREANRARRSLRRASAAQGNSAPAIATDEQPMPDGQGAIADKYSQASNGELTNEQQHSSPRAMNLSAGRGKKPNLTVKKSQQPGKQPYARPLSQAEENRKAKLMAEQWIVGDE